MKVNTPGVPGAVHLTLPSGPNTNPAGGVRCALATVPAGTSVSFARIPGPGTLSACPGATVNESSLVLGPATAAVLRRLGRDASYARGHRETSTTGKIDPSFINLDSMRADVAAKMSSPPMREFGMPSKQGVTYGNSTQIFAVSTSEARNLYQRVFVPGEGWRAWTDLGGSLLGQPSVVLYGNQLQVWARGTDNSIFQLVYDGGWRPWTSIGGGPMTSDPVPVYHGGNLNVFARNPGRQRRLPAVPAGPRLARMDRPWRRALHQPTGPGHVRAVSQRLRPPLQRQHRLPWLRSQRRMAGLVQPRWRTALADVPPCVECGRGCRGGC